ncbi:sulfite exporter TauE/SafE family protein [Ostreibacterium oceani]|uniref:Probable membrane transporter protein n=1 Tax=Ostreibacterium oceani TaxID=2654998 RepID=A0A6N7F140_9GAMM|nr:sulfite exporter TauE/SafE family protein [Ostreibacterium oceani]MPV86508.1 TSUP family transporter [Ostreibacterium oceani]
MEYTLIEAVILMGLGLVAGVINVLAGGGSNLTVPALMVLGMPADIANATNRVGIFLQGIIGVTGFKRHKKLPTGDFKAILVPTLMGGLAGSLMAAYTPPVLLKYILLGAMLSVALIVLVRPNIIIPPAGTIPFMVSERPQAWWLLLLAGFYGGLVQAGVGFILIAAFAGALRYDLVASNALKLLTTLFFTGIALIIFIANDQVRWIPGLILAVGTMLGAHIGVKLALKVSQNTLKWFLFLMTLAASAAAIFF